MWKWLTKKTLSYITCSRPKYDSKCQITLILIHLFLCTGYHYRTIFVACNWTKSKWRRCRPLQSDRTWRVHVGWCTNNIHIQWLYLWNPQARIQLLKIIRLFWNYELIFKTKKKKNLEHPNNITELSKLCKQWIKKVK